MKKRIIAAILDLLLVLIIWQILSCIYYEFTNNFIPYYFAVLIYALRDLVFLKSSLFKKALGLEIVKQDGSKPKIYEIILRNITIFIWPIDFLFLVKNKNRICDDFLKLKVEEKNEINIALLLLILIFLLISFFTLAYYTIPFFYKETFNISLPYYYKKESIVRPTGRGYEKNLEIMYYRKEKINKIKDMTAFKSMDNEIYKIYDEVINKLFIPTLAEEELEAFNNNFNIKELATDTNYYALLEDDNDCKGYIFSLLILDTKNNKLYSIYSNYYRNMFYNNKQLTD